MAQFDTRQGTVLFEIPQAPVGQYRRRPIFERFKYTLMIQL